MPINDEIRGRIAALERDGERIAGTIESCRKAMLIARAALWIGAAVFIVGVSGLVRLPVAIIFVSFAAIIGGIVFYGSNRSTRLEAEARARAIDLERAQWIDKLELFDSGATLH